MRRPQSPRELAGSAARHGTRSPTSSRCSPSSRALHQAGLALGLKWQLSRPRRGEDVARGSTLARPHRHATFPRSSGLSARFRSLVDRHRWRDRVPNESARELPASSEAWSAQRRFDVTEYGRAAGDAVRLRSPRSRNSVCGPFRCSSGNVPAAAASTRRPLFADHRGLGEDVPRVGGLGLEGIVGKADAAYRAGRSADWIKVRHDRTGTSPSSAAPRRRGRAPGQPSSPR
jgi:hypothetical protein